MSETLDGMRSDVKRSDSGRTMKLRHPAGNVGTRTSSRELGAATGLSVEPGYPPFFSYSSQF